MKKGFLTVLSNYNCFGGRKICIGKSGEAIAWTDGYSYIALEREWLKDINLNSLTAVNRLFSTLCHEIAHDEESQGTHIHGSLFYEKYYIITQGDDNPFLFLNDFIRKIENIVYKERKQKEEEKELKKQQEIKEKLGINALTQ